MLSLAWGIDDHYDYDGETYAIDLSFDNVLRIIEIVEDKSLNDAIKTNLAYDALFDENGPYQQTNYDDPTANIEEKSLIFNDIFTNIIVKDNSAGILTDIDGNPMPTATSEEDESVSGYSLTKDADMIFASFMQEYGIDLIEHRGRMHWFKFRALFEGLRDDTTIKTIISIRTTPLPTGEDNRDERERLMKLKKIYELKED